MTKRISIRIRDPNPLFRTWLSEWANHAEVEGREMLATSLRRALTSLEKYPCPLQSVRECHILDGFGPNICKLLDKKLAKHRLEEAAGPSTANINLPAPVASPQKSKPANPKIQHTQSQELVSNPVPSTSAPTKRLRKTKSEQSLPKPSGNEKKDSVPVKPGVKRKATAPIESVIQEDVIMSAGSFEIILLVDSMETVGKNKRHMDATLLELNKTGVRYEVRHLNVGDFTWIARDKHGNELVLPFIVERKRLDDLAGSIKSGRYHEQKFRLRSSGIPNVIYLIEYLDVKNYGLPIQTLYKAVVNSEVHSDCQVKYTDSPKDTILYLSVQTTLLTELFAKKMLCSCAKEQLPTAETADDLINSDMASLMHFGEFNQAASKWGCVQIKDFFVRQLIQLAQMTVEKAMAITNVYPTPRALLTAYASAELEDDAARRGLLSKITYGAAKRTIGASLSKIIFDLYHTETPS